MGQKRRYTVEIQVKTNVDSSVTELSILSQLSSIYDQLGVISPTMVEGKRIYKEACDEKTGWNSEVSSATRRDWLKWGNQLKNVKVRRSIVKEMSKINRVQLHVFANASKTACSGRTAAVVKHSTGFVKGLLTSKSRISKQNKTITRPELVSGQMAANCTVLDL